MAEIKINYDDFGDAISNIKKLKARCEDAKSDINSLSGGEKSSGVCSEKVKKQKENLKSVANSIRFYYLKLKVS